ncbi:MAG: cobyric acid synthase, partial [Candidatus Binatia bacterium]
MNSEEMTRKNALMILGTASHVGKSILTAGLGRVFADEGYRVAPFKAQNMSLNSAATPDGGEIGRAQALQAEACRAVARVEMNPILLKPSTDTGAQVILLGKIWGQVTAADYHSRRVELLFPAVLDAYKRLAHDHDLILLEGAGSPAEINLRDHDIVNMRMAHAAEAVCLLVGDIDRGGVFASLLGTLELLEPEDRARIHGFVINKFRGDESLLRPGVIAMEHRLGLPCVGVVPYLPDLGLDEEDGVALEDRASAVRRWNIHETGPARPLRIGVIALPHMANFTDFDPLALEPSVSLAFLEHPEETAGADLLVLPGSKQTLDDLEWLEGRGFVPRLRQLYE